MVLIWKKSGHIGKISLANTITSLSHFKRYISSWLKKLAKFGASTKFEWFLLEKNPSNSSIFRNFGGHLEKKTAILERANGSLSHFKRYISSFVQNSVLLTKFEQFLHIFTSENGWTNRKGLIYEHTSAIRVTTLVAAALITTYTSIHAAVAAANHVMVYFWPFVTSFAISLLSMKLGQTIIVVKIRCNRTSSLTFFYELLLLLLLLLMLLLLLLLQLLLLLLLLLVTWVPTKILINLCYSTVLKFPILKTETYTTQKR